MTGLSESQTCAFHDEFRPSASTSNTPVFIPAYIVGIDSENRDIRASREPQVLETEGTLGLAQDAGGTQVQQIKSYKGPAEYADPAPRPEESLTSKISIDFRYQDELLAIIGTNKRSDIATKQDVDRGCH